MKTPDHNRELIWKQLDQKLKGLRRFVIPKEGWVKTLREALGMSKAQLGRRCKLSYQRIQQIEIDEVAKTTTLETLEKVAAQMECRLVYAFVPNDKISNIIDRQAEIKAIEQIKGNADLVSSDGKTDRQKVSGRQFASVRQSLILKSLRSIWG